MQHPLRGVVGELQPPLRIHDDDPFHHAGEDRFHPPAIARLLGEAPRDVLHRLVQRPGDHAELVVAEVHARRRQVAAAVAVGEVGDDAHAARCRAEKTLAMSQRTDEGDDQHSELSR